MLSRLKAELRQVRLFLWRERQRGHGLLKSFLLRLPRAVVRKLYSKAARSINSHLLASTVNATRFRSFTAREVRATQPCFYVIVMPNVLHFLLPCLRLVPEHVQIVLLFNGAQPWERKHLQQEFPRLASFNLCTMPRSSLSHGDVLTLLLRHHEDSFGIFDHDLYVFDPRIFDCLDIGAEEYALSVYTYQSLRTGIEVPLTHFLFLNAANLRDIMRRYRVNAKQRRNAPRHLQPLFDRLGLRRGIFLKDYHNFFDTLNILFALAHAEGLRNGLIPLGGPDAVYHVGGTSIGDQRTRALADVYIQLRFLELANDPVLSRGYAHLRQEFSTADDVLRRLTQDQETVRMLMTVQRVTELLEAAGVTSTASSVDLS